MTYIANHNHDLVIGKKYEGTDFISRTVGAVDYHFGNVQVKVFNSFYSKIEWLPAPEWNKLYPRNKIVREET